MPLPKASPLLDRRKAPRDGDSWLPEFCSLPVALSMMIVAELVLLFVAIAPARSGASDLATLTVGTVFVQWLCACNLVLLCLVRPRLVRLPTSVATSLAMASVAAVSAVGSGVAFWLDGVLELQAIPPATSPGWFAGSIAAMAVIVAAVALRYHYVTAQWRLGVAAQARAQFDALQARIRPHFLFNSMNTIASLIRTRPEDAERAVEDLSDLFRATLRDEDRTATLADELDLVRRYLSIETLRLGNRLRVTIDDTALPELELPALLLQPLVENAVLHGIQAVPEGGEVTVNIATHRERVVIAITNPKPRRPTPSRGSGTALDNVRRRLQYRYQDRARMEVDDGGDYYRVTLSLPMP